MYDTGAEVNAISRKVADLLNLKVEPLKNTRIIAYIGKESVSRGIVRNVIIRVSGDPLNDISRIRQKGSIYMIDDVDGRYNIILG